MRMVLALASMLLVAACGDPGRATVEDAQDAKQSARDAVQAAEKAAKRIEKLSQPAAPEPDST